MAEWMEQQWLSIMEASNHSLLLFITHYQRSTVWRTIRNEETTLDSLATLPSMDRALYRSAEAMPLSTFSLHGAHSLYRPVPHCAACQPRSAWPQDLLLMFAANWSTPSLFSSKQPAVQFHSGNAGTSPAWSQDLPPTSQHTSAKPLHLTHALMYDILRLQ
jgi:hypothetical protein